MLARASLVLVVTATAAHASSDLAHPGLLHSRADLERMRAAVAARQQPTFAGFEKFRASPASQASYQMRGPSAEIGRSPNVATADFDSDANAAYQCALMAWITGDAAYADRTREILNAWSATLRRVTGADAVLMAGLGPFKLVNAAELLRSSTFGWADEEVARAQRMFRESIYPVLQDFAPFANGNWDTAAIKTMAAIAVFCDDRAMFERALRYYVAGSGDGCLTHYIINEAGQCQESGRDMPHTQLGLAHLGDTCEIAWHQGLDLYGYAENRLLKGFEYTARYNLGEDVPFVETTDRTGKYHHTRISTRGRGNLRAVFEEIYNHYVNRCGLPAPWTTKAAATVRPEGPGLPGADHPGFGTLLFTRTPEDTRREASNDTALARPSGLVALSRPTAIRLTWIPVRNATAYAVSRSIYDPSTAQWGEPEPVATNIRVAAYDDSSAAPGRAYRYAVSAINAKGRSEPSWPTAITAGLPAGWQVQKIGGGASGDAQYDGERVTLEAGGKAIGGTADAFLFANVRRTGAVTLRARFVPQVSSQFSQFGLMLRAGAEVDVPFAAVVLLPDHFGDAERPGWSVKLVARGTADGAVPVGQPLREPLVRHGRLMAPCWLSLERKGARVTARFSADGQEWITVGAVNVLLPDEVEAGLAACSGVSGLKTTVRFADIDVSP